MPEIDFPIGGNLMDPADPDSALKPATHSDAPTFPGGKEPGRDISEEGDKPPHQNNNEPPDLQLKEK